MTFRRPSRWLAAFAALACSAAHATSAYADVQLEYRVKAAFLYNFAKFVSWPEEAFASEEDPIRICVAGRDPFGGVLDATVAGKTVGKRGFIVARVSRLEGVASCHLLYANATNRSAEKELLDAVGSRPVLTVGELDPNHIGLRIINFVLVDGKVRFEIDRQAAQRAGLTVSSKLLSVAAAVHDGKGT